MREKIEAESSQTEKSDSQFETMLDTPVLQHSAPDPNSRTRTSTKRQSMAYNVLYLAYRY